MMFIAVDLLIGLLDNVVSMWFFALSSSQKKAEGEVLSGIHKNGQESIVPEGENFDAIAFFYHVFIQSC